MVYLKQFNDKLIKPSAAVNSKKALTFFGNNDKWIFRIIIYFRCI